MKETNLMLAMRQFFAHNADKFTVFSDDDFADEEWQDVVCSLPLPFCNIQSFMISLFKNRGHLEVYDMVFRSNNATKFTVLDGSGHGMVYGELYPNFRVKLSLPSQVQSYGN